MESYKAARTSSAGFPCDREGLTSKTVEGPWSRIEQHQKIELTSESKVFKAAVWAANAPEASKMAFDLSTKLEMALTTSISNGTVAPGRRL
jgi:hypothetical protein